ncbi:MAG: hypothetical protein AB7Q97_26715 [Gammaproteobacteria bacterium]
MSNAELLVDALRPGRCDSLWNAPLPWHADAEVMHQGNRWHAAGLATHPRQRAAIAAAERALYPGGSRYTDVRAWDCAGAEVAIVEWRQCATAWNGIEVDNGGAMIVEFDGGRIRRLRNFTNTALLEAVESGWADRIDLDTLMALPAWHTLGQAPLHWRPYPPAADSARRGDPPRRYPEPITNEARVHRRYDPRGLFADIPIAHYYALAHDAYIEFQGTRWFLAGRNPNSAIEGQPDATSAVFSAVFVPASFGFTHNRTWATTSDRWVFMEWVSASDTPTGVPFRNHGLTLLHFDDGDLVTEHREYANVAYLEAHQADLPARVSPETLAPYACAKTWAEDPARWRALPIPAEHAQPAHRAHARARIDR